MSGPRLFVRSHNGRARGHGQVVNDGAEERRGRPLYEAQRRSVRRSVAAVPRARGRPVHLHGRRAIAIRPERVVGDAQSDAVDGETDRGDRGRGTVLIDGRGVAACAAVVLQGFTGGGRRAVRQDAQVERAAEAVQRVLDGHEHRARGGARIRPRRPHLLGHAVQTADERAVDHETPAVVQSTGGARKVRVRLVLVQHVRLHGRPDGCRHVVARRPRRVVRDVPECHLFQEVPARKTSRCVSVRMQCRV